MEKWCFACELRLPVAEFHKNKNYPDGLATTCRACAKARRRVCYLAWRSRGICTVCRAVRTGDRAVCPDCRKKQDLRVDGLRAAQKCVQCRKATTGARMRCEECSVGHRLRQLRYRGLSRAVTPEDVQRAMEAQESKCAVCQRALGSEEPPHIDHCSASGVMRGILCGPCNSAIGFLRHDPAIIRAAARYLEASPAAGLRKLA